VIIALAAIVVAFFGAETLRATRNERAQRAAGGIEPAGDVYAAMRLAYPGSFAAILIEGALRARPSTAVIVAGALLFGAAKALKWWAIVTLRSAWTFRIIVVPGAPRIDGGPYRLMRHPNYVGVIGELVGVALMTGARGTGPVATLVFATLIAKRIRIEERALTALSPPAPTNV